MAKSKSNAGAAAPTADDSADKPTHDVVNTTPDPVGAPDNDPQDDPTPDTEETANEVINTTENLHEGATDEPPSRAVKQPLSDSDRTNIVKEFNAEGASVQAIADKYDIEPAEVFAIANESNEANDNE